METGPLVTRHFSENKLVDALFEEARAPVLLLTVDFLIVKANHAAWVFFGDPLDSTGSLRIDSIVGKASAAKLATVASMLRSDGETGNVRLSLVDFTGARRSIAATLRRVDCDDCGVPHLILALREAKPAPSGPLGDIDPKLLVTRLLRGLSDSVFLIDYQDRTICDCNSAAELMFGYEREELLGRSPHFLAVDTESAKDHVWRSRASYARTGFYQSKMRCRKKDGSPFMTLATNIALFDTSGALRYILAINRDISLDEQRFEQILGLAEKARVIMQLLEESILPLKSATSSSSLQMLGFSDRQIDIAILLLSGSPTKAIAVRLGISESAVKNHLSSMYRRTRVGSRIEFAKYVHDHGISLE